jgi:hypothetical protein
MKATGDPTTIKRKPSKPNGMAASLGGNQILSVKRASTPTPIAMSPSPPAPIVGQEPHAAKLGLGCWPLIANIGRVQVKRTKAERTKRTQMTALPTFKVSQTFRS